jgi:3-methyladenine DNA glycosylase AlkD
MTVAESLVERVKRTQHGFGDIAKAADEVIATHADSIEIAHTLFASDVHQARMLAVFIFGHWAAKSEDILKFMRTEINRDADWRVQEILAQAFDRYCADVGYQQAMPVIQDWLKDEHPNVRLAVSEGLRIWTARPYFREHPYVAVHLLSALKADPSEYVRKSMGNALRDISRKHADLVRAEVQTWDLSNKSIQQTHKLASKFL